MTGHATPPHGGHEKRDISSRAVLLSGIGLLLGVVVSLVAMKWTFDYFAARETSRQEPVSALAAGRTDAPPEPRLQTDPFEDLRILQASERERLTSYGWVDRPRGIVRIPVDRALDLVAERGLPRWEAPEGKAEPAAKGEDG